MSGDGPAAALLEWYGGRERDVPWRGEEDPYRVWVAEVMAQQTRMETVRDYYASFLRRFPNVETLAAAELEEVLKEWEGLGYYARARNLHRAARRLLRDEGGRVPRKADALKELPGVGRYTAGAVASLAFGEPAPAVDGNARRVLARLFDMERPTAGRLDERARELLEAAPDRPADLNQALMDLGGQLCTPSEPECGACPLGDHCLARERGTVALRPPARSRGPVPHHDVGVGVDHAYSHLRVTLHAHHARAMEEGTPRARAATDWDWRRVEELGELPFPVANQKILASLRELDVPPEF